MESKLSNLPVKVLAEIAKRAIENQFDFENPYDYGYEESADILEESTSWTGVGTIEALDIEFMAKFISSNSEILTSWIDSGKKFKDLPNLYIPKSKKFIVNYSSKGRGYVIQNYNTDWNSYDEDWVSDAMSALNSVGDWSYYDGNYDGTDVDDFEEDDLDVESIEEVKGRKGRNESVLGILVVENTKDVVKSLDKKTLLELRRIIDSKLRLL